MYLSRGLICAFVFQYVRLWFIRVALCSALRNPQLSCWNKTTLRSLSDDSWSTKSDDISTRYGSSCPCEISEFPTDKLAQNTRLHLIFQIPDEWLRTERN